MIVSRGVFFSILAVAVLVLTAGCERWDMGQIFDSGPKMTVAQATYGATDALATQARNTVSQNTILVAGPVHKIGAAAKPSSLGQQIHNNVTARLVQLGYTVADQAPPGGEYAKITGDYTRVGNDVLVNLRITDMKAGRILAAHDYRIPVTGEVRDLIKADEVPADGQPQQGDGRAAPSMDEQPQPLGDIFSEGWAK